MLRYSILVVIAASLVAAERDTAEWVIRSGGRVVLEGNRTPIRDLLSLLDGEIHITGVDLFGTLVEATELEKLSGLSGLKELYLAGPMFNPASGSRLDANAQLKFLAGLKSLEKLSFSLHFLTHVNVQDKGLALLTGLSGLKEFRCAQCKIEKLSLAPLTNLESLDLSFSEFSDEAMKGLADMQNLKRLSLRDTLITDEGLRSIDGLTKLEELDLGGVRISDAGLAHLRNMKAMRKLNLLGANVSDESVDVLTGMPRLMELNLYRSRLTNSGLSRLTALKSLADLDLRYSRVTPTALQSFRAALPT